MGDVIVNEKYVHQAYTELNPLTGLFYNRAFFRKADKWIKDNKPLNYCLVAIDIENFRVFNKMYGRDEGDKLLVHVTACIKKIESEYGGVTGYMGGDNFCIIMPDSEQIVSVIESNITKGIEQYNNTLGFYPVFGVYAFELNDESTVSMYDKATMAISNEKGNYTKHVVRYDSRIEDEKEDEIKLIAEVQAALEHGDFTFYAQPQCDIATGKIVGAESLVRWKHKEKGIVPPMAFIPVLEKSGLIVELDKIVWRKVCEWLRSWIDRGYHPVPVSVNVSRIDIMSMDVAEYFIGLVDLFKLSPKLVKVEITESAYAESNDSINPTVKRLRDAGFVVMMDDFGSGYSSLNMLKNVSVDVIKIDMRFLDIKENDSEDEEKGVGILESVVNMARLMGLPIIVEGVENQTQENFLLNMGCRYTQGYYYYRPLPINQLEELLADEKNLDYSGVMAKQLENLHVREFLDDNLYDEKMINNMLGAIAFYEMEDDKIEITRANEQYYRLAGVTPSAKGEENKRMWNHIRDDEKRKLNNLFMDAYRHKNEGAEGNIHFVKSNSEVIRVHIRIFFINETEESKLFCGSLVEIDMDETNVVNEAPVLSIEEMSDVQVKRMERHYENMPCGYCVTKVFAEDNKPTGYTIVYANKELRKICGGASDTIRRVIGKLFGEELDVILQKAYEAAYLGVTTHHYVYSHVSNVYLQLSFYKYEDGYAGCMLNDVTHLRLYEGALNGIMKIFRAVYHINVKENYTRMIYPFSDNILERGNYEEYINRYLGMVPLYEKDRDKVVEFMSLDNIRYSLRDKDMIECRYRVVRPDDSIEWRMASMIVSDRNEYGVTSAVFTVRNIDDMVQAEDERRKIKMAKMLARMSEGLFIYTASDDEKIVYASPRMVTMFGCKDTKEFNEYINNSFKGMVHPEDKARVEAEIKEQIENSNSKVDYIQYRIIKKDGEVRWVEDYGHLQAAGQTGEADLYYVFLSDVTDTLSESRKNLLVQSNYKHNVDFN